MNKWWLLVWASLISWVQAYFLSAVGGGVVLINLAVIYVVIVSLQRNLATALPVGLLCGFWLDVASSTQFGSRMLFFAGLVGLVNLIKKGGVIVESRLALAVLAALACLLYGLWLLVWAWIDVGGFFWSLELLNTLLAEILISATIAALFYGQWQFLAREPRYA